MTIDPTCDRPPWSRWVRLSVAAGGAALLITGVLTATGARPVLDTLAQALIHAATMGTLCGLVVPRVLARGPRTGLGLRFAMLVPVLLALALVGTLVGCSIITLVGLAPAAAFRALFATAVWINALLTVTVAFGMTLYETQRARLDAVTLDLRTKQLEHERAAKMALEARLSSLESRLHPHFLFNTLNAISALIPEDPALAERTVERLAALLRFSLDATAHGMVTVADEMRIVADYLEIERTRLGERLSWSVKVDRDVHDCAIPVLAIQTLVENSVKHAIAPRPGTGHVAVDVAAHDDRIVVSVWDDGPGFGPDIRVPGHGLDDLDARLAARFAGAAAVAVARDDGGTRVTVSLPRLERPS